MKTKEETLAYLKANQGKGFDFDGAYGIQCMDLINQVTVNVLGNINITAGCMYPNEVFDKVIAGKCPGYTVHKESQPGDIFVTIKCSTSPVGHIGFIAEDNSHIYDQNGTSRHDPITYRKGLDGIYRGFIRPPYSASSTSTTPNNPSGIITQTGIMKVTVDTLNMRNLPSVSGGIVATYSKGQTLNYDGYVDAEGYRWVTYVSASGKRRYVARRKLDNSQVFGDCY